MRLLHPAVAAVQEIESLWCDDHKLAQKRACFVVTFLIEAGFLKGHHVGPFPYEGPLPEKPADPIMRHDGKLDRG